MVSMANMKKYLNHVNTSDPTEKNIDDETRNIYKKRVDDSKELVKTINDIGATEPRERLLGIMKFVEEILLGKKSETIPESEKLDAAQGEAEDIGDSPPLESEEEAAKRQKRQGLKIMTPKQITVRLPELLAQLKAGNISQKLKNEIRQIVYSLYRSKNLSQTIYNHLISTI